MIRTYLKRIKNAALGDEREMENRLKSSFGEKDLGGIVHNIRKQNMTAYLIATLIIAVLVATFIGELLTKKDIISEIEKPNFGEHVQNVKAEVVAEFGDLLIEKDVMFQVTPRTISEAEKANRIKRCENILPELLAANVDLDAVDKDLILPSYHEETGVNLTWASETPDVIDDEGHVNFINGKKGDAVLLAVRMELGNLAQEALIEVVLGMPQEEKSIEASIGKEVDDVISKLEEQKDVKSLMLPQRTAGGVKLEWKEAGQTPPILGMLLVCIFIVFIYKNRYRSIDKKINQKKSEMEKMFPEFITKLLLLLNAGLVIPAAIKKIADDYQLRKKDGRGNYFYDELMEMDFRVTETKASVTAELSSLAVRSGLQEFSRLAAIISDNIDKGSVVAEKLQIERDLLWTKRKKQAEEKGRIAETKLTFPMVFTLLALVLITTAPALADL